MTFRRWTEAVEAIDRTAAPVSREQLALAKVAGCLIDPGTPSLVAAAMLRDGLSDHLCLRRPGELYESTYDYLARLASVEGVDPAPSTRDEAEAGLRTATCLNGDGHLQS